LGRKWKRDKIREIEEGVVQDSNLLTKTTIVEVLDEYLREATPGKARSALKREESKVKILKEAFSKQTLQSLLPKDVEEFVKERQRQKRKPSTINRDIVVLHQALTRYTKRRRVRYEPPTVVARQVLKYDDALIVMDARKRKFKGDEEQRLMKALRHNPVMQEAVILLVETAMRREELCNARWEHIKERVLIIPEHKTKRKTREERAVPLSPAALAALNRLPRRLDGRILGLRPDSLTQAFSRACKRAGIKDLRVHDLRREATTRLLKKPNSSIAVVQAVTGHADLRSLARYTAIVAEEIAEDWALEEEGSVATPSPLSRR
jgi:integrase